jgi:CheY-like chemotaxis protein
MKRILVAEDNDSNYLLMTFILKGHYDFFRAINGQDAVDKASTEHPT